MKKINDLKYCIEKIEKNKVISKKSRNILKNIEFEEELLIQDICNYLTKESTD